jgi:colanic acid biosynthesis protein WcaH
MLSREDFLQVVRSAPLVSIDLIVRNADGLVLLGLRNNRPARGWWFVPGGIVRKDERLEQAFRRISEAELGSGQELSAARLIGHYEHLYEDNFAGEPGFGTHYVVLVWELALLQDPAALPRQQHREYRWVTVEALASEPTIHPNSQAYAASLGPSQPLPRRV